MTEVFQNLLHSTVAPFKKYLSASEQGVCNFFHIRSVGEETSLHVAFLVDS